MPQQTLTGENWKKSSRLPSAIFIRDCSVDSFFVYLLNIRMDFNLIHPFHLHQLPKIVTQKICIIDYKASIKMISHKIH